MNQDTDSELVPPAHPTQALVGRAESTIQQAAAKRDTGALKVVHDQADALQKLAREAAKKSKTLGGHLKKLNDLARIRIVAAREMGIILHELVRRGGPRFRGRTLDELGIGRNQSAKWQKLAQLPDMVEAYVDACSNRAEEASIAGYMRYARNEPHFSSESNDWCTPEHIVLACQAVLGDIETDPCSNLGSPNVPAKTHFTIEDDGLAHTWRGPTFMNPPYGRTLRLWVRKLTREHDAGNVPRAIALLPARPGSDWFDELAMFPVCFLRGRLRFSEGSPAPFPSMCIYLGGDRDRFLETFRTLGCLYEPCGH